MSDNHEMRQGSLIKVCRILLRRTQNPTIRPGICEFEVIVLNMTVGTAMTINLHQQNFTALQFYLDLEAKFCEALVLKQNQVFVKTASKQPQETKCIFNRIFE